MNIHIIRTDGTEEHVQAPWAAIYKLIGAATCDTVNLRDGRVMLVDDAGYETETVEHGPGPDPVHGLPMAFRTELKPVRARKPVNAKATALYHSVCRPGTTHQIVGDVAIVIDAEVDA